MKKQFFLLAVMISTSSCDANSRIQHSGRSGLSEAQQEQYIALGKAGVGEALRIVIDDNTMNASNPFRDHIQMRAEGLANNSPHLNEEYAGRLYERALYLPRGSVSRNLVLDEAQIRLEIAVKSFFLIDFIYPNAIGREGRDRGYARVMARYDEKFAEIAAAR